MDSYALAVHYMSNRVEVVFDIPPGQQYGQLLCRAPITGELDLKGLVAMVTCTGDYNGFRGIYFIDWNLHRAHQDIKIFCISQSSPPCKFTIETIPDPEIQTRRLFIHSTSYYRMTVHMFPFLCSWSFLGYY